MSVVLSSDNILGVTIINCAVVFFIKWYTQQQHAIFAGNKLSFRVEGGSRPNVYLRGTGHAPKQSSLGNILLDVIHCCLIVLFSEHEGSTSKTMTTEKPHHNIRQGI